MFFCEGSVIFDISSIRHCLGKICCTSFYHWKLPFPPWPCGWPSRWSLTCFAPLRVTSVPWPPCFPPHPKIPCALLCFCLVPDLFLLPRMVHWLPVFCLIALNFVPTSQDAHCFLFISFSTVASRSHYVAKVSLIFLDYLKASWIFRTLVCLKLAVLIFCCVINRFLFKMTFIKT